MADLVAKTLQLDRDFAGWPAATIQSIAVPTLMINGDADIVRPEHAVEMFRLLGPTGQLAILPGTTHEGLVDRPDLSSLSSLRSVRSETPRRVEFRVTRRRGDSRPGRLYLEPRDK